MRAGSLASSGARHALVAIGEALVVAVIIATVLLVLSPLYRPAQTLSGTSIADARGGSGISVPNGVFGGTTTATISGGSGTWAVARCYQGSTLVYGEYVEASAAKTATFTLGPTQIWTSGSATCTAEAGYWGKSGRWHGVASTSFSVRG